MNKKSLIVTSILVGSMLFSSTASAYTEIECTDAIFTQHNCNQCFD